MEWIVALGVWVVDKGLKLLEKGEEIASRVALAMAVVYHGRDLRSFLSKNNPLVANFLSEHVAGLTETLARGQDGVLNDLADQVMAGHDTAADATDLSSLTRAAADVYAHPAKAAAEFDAHKPAMGQLAAKAEEVLQGVIKGLLGIYTEGLQARRGELPEGVNDVAAGMVSRAVKFGLGAQLAALAVEAVYFTKNTGLNQLVGYIANFAGFDKVTQPIIAPQLKWALAIPAEHQAAKLYRTRIPGAEDVRDQAVQRHVTARDYANALRLEGFPEDWIRVKVADMFVDPRPREIITLTEGVDADPEWLVAKYRETGWDDGDVKRAVEATMRRVRKPAAERYARTLGTSYLNGFRTLAQVETALRNVTRDDAYIDLWLKSLVEEKAHRNAEQLADAVLDQFQNSVIGPAAAADLLAALGFQSSEVARRRAVTELRRNERLVKEDVAEVEVLARQLKGQALTSLRSELRAGRLTVADFLAFGRMLGYVDSFLAAVADLELLKADPVVVQGLATVGLEQLATALHDVQAIPLGDDGKPLAEFQALATAALANLKAQLRAGTLARVEFVALGRMLGLDALTLEQLADVELLRATVPAAVLASSDAAVLASAAHAALVDLAADLVQRRVLAASVALRLLTEAGVPVTPATVAIAIAEVLASNAAELSIFPFNDLSDGKLVWTSVLGQLAGALGDAGTTSGPLAEILSAISRSQTAVTNVTTLRDNLKALFGGRQARTRAPAKTERVAPPDPLTVPEEHPVFTEVGFVPGPAGPTTGGPQPTVPPGAKK